MNRLLSILLVCLLQLPLAVASAHNLRVEVTPKGAGSVNITQGTYDEGRIIGLMTDPRQNGFVFKGWYEGDNLLSSERDFSYTMPGRDVVLQAKYEYDPSVPDNPDYAKAYRLTLVSSPQGAANFPFDEERFNEGESVDVWTDPRGGYQFTGWVNEQGEVISEERNFQFTMPAKNTRLTAHFVYDPSAPENPEPEGVHITLKSKPSRAGGFNVPGNFFAQKGETVELRTWEREGFDFQYWEDEDGNVISRENPLQYIVPEKDVKLYAVYEYNPETPTNPGTNSWDSETGELIMDDFREGELTNAISNAVKGDNGKVASITISGRMAEGDFGITDICSVCTHLDLSRVAGVTHVPSRAFDNTTLVLVSLPASIETIGYKAFADCQSLGEITCYSLFPPVLEPEVFSGSSSVVVKVPSSVISRYREAEGWKDLTIQSVDEDLRTISVYLPTGTPLADFNQMWLELYNTKNGQRIHYVMTGEKGDYAFSNIIRNTSWNVSIRNERGDVFGQIEEINVEEEDVTVEFENLSIPQNVKLSVLAGTDIVTSKMGIVWTDNTGNILSQADFLKGLPVGTELQYSLTMDKDLTMKYLLPEGDAKHIVADGDNAISVALEPIKQVTLTGKVMNVSSEEPLPGAIVTATQTFGGKYTTTQTVKADATGAYTLYNMYCVPTTLTFGSTDFISRTVSLKQPQEGALETVALKPISGATITFGYTFTPSVVADTQPETQYGYCDYNNVDYTIYNKTKQETINEISVQYPKIVLLEDVAEGDELELTATSRTDAFKAVTVGAVINDALQATAIFPILEWGKISAGFVSAKNTTVVATLYDAKGKFVKSCDYTDASALFEGLTDGSYTLVSMGSSTLFNTIYDLSQLPNTGLVQGKDYVQETVEVKSGSITTVVIPEVPLLDESKLYYTEDSKTSFTVNKPSIVIGNNLTLTAKIGFKEVYGNVDNVSLVVDIPEGCGFVDNSVLVGNNLASDYSLGNGRLTVHLADYSERIRFCVVPSVKGSYAPTAYVRFSMNGKTITQPIGSAHYETKNLTLNVPPVVAQKMVPVSGTTTGKSVVEIYDNGVLIGQTTSLKNGVWNTKCELLEPENLSKHLISAVVRPENSAVTMNTEVKECLYDESAILPVKVTMINTAHPATSLNTTEYVTVFDFMDPPVSIPAYWYWPDYPKFTFMVELTKIDPEGIDNVYVNVYDVAGNIHSLKTLYDAKRGVWVAYSDFDSFHLPKNVSVTIEYTQDGETYTVTYDSNNPDAPNVMDPSGYVYEGVSTNRLQGVTATVYYKESVENQWGDMEEQIVKWDATEYGQENPLYTDENGMYAWDVPQGLWQVKFEKEGYETAYSEWLPVPPPQLDVNIAMKQSVQPEIKAAAAYQNVTLETAQKEARRKAPEAGQEVETTVVKKDVVEFEFSKFMLSETLTIDNITVSQDGVDLKGTLQLLDEEVAEDGTTKCASKVRFISDNPFEGGEVKLVVHPQVKSYAGIPFGTQPENTFNIEYKVESLVVELLSTLVYDGDAKVRITALPTEAAVGKTVLLSSSSEIIAGLSEKSVTLDANGTAEVIVTGDLPGASIITARLDETDIVANTEITVNAVALETIEKPMASLASGSSIYPGTVIRLTCATEGTEIYYTIDDVTTVYNAGEPIVVDFKEDNDITITTVAKKGDRESETVEYKFSRMETTVNMDLQQGWNWISHNRDEPISVDAITSKAKVSRIVSQEQELINDPVYGLVGNLTELSPSSAYKIQVSEGSSHSFTGYAFNPNNKIELKKGWNWISYPMLREMSLASAFENLQLEPEDYIFGHNEGFALYDASGWKGTLTDLKPGHGYLFYANSPKTFSYSADNVSKTKARYAKGLPNYSPWTAVDAGKYPNMMGVVADVYENGVKAESGKFYVGAFCGTECRGVGNYENGVLFMSVYGNNGDKIVFVAMDARDEMVYDISGVVTFREALLGSYNAPYQLNIGDTTTDIAGVNTGCKVWPAVASTNIYVSGVAERIERVAITGMGGNVVATLQNVPNDTSINISNLADGMYIVAVTSGGSTFYQKIIKK